jgi:hypothetical protein
MYTDALSSAKDIKHCDSGVSWSTENCFNDSGNGLAAELRVIWLYRATCKCIYTVLKLLFSKNHKNKNSSNYRIGI